MFLIFPGKIVFLLEFARFKEITLLAFGEELISRSISGSTSTDFFFRGEEKHGLG